MRRFLLILFNLLWVASGFAWQGTLQTRDNRVASGEMFFHTADTLIVTPPVGAAFRVPLAHVLQITFSTAVARVESPHPLLTLRNGSTMSVQLRSMDDSVAKFNIAHRAFSIATLEVSRVLFRVVPEFHLNKIASDRRGVLLGNGDFLDGDLVKLDNHALQLNSTLFGLRRLDLTNQAAALFLRPTVASTNLWEVQAADGSVLHTDTLAPELDQLIVHDPYFGVFRIPLNQLLRLRRNRP